MATSNDDLDVRDIYKSKFLVGEDLNGQEVTATIMKAGIQQLQADDGEPELKIKILLRPQSDDPEIVKAFKKPLVLCKKEATKLGRLMGNPKAKFWVGGVVTIFPMRGRFFGVDQVVPRLKDKATKPNGTPPAA